MVDTCCKAADRRNKKGSGFTRLCAGLERGYAGLSSLLRAKREPEKHPLLSRRWNRRVAAPSVCFAAARILLAAAPTAPPCIRRRRRSSPLQERGCSPLIIPEELSKHKNASRFAKRIFCTSPVYGSADGVTLQQDFTFCKGVKSAAKQQMGETRKKCNSDDCRLRRIQGGAVGAAVSRTRVPLKARSGRWAPQPVLAQRLAFFRFDFFFGIVKGEQPLTRCGESGVQR